MTIENLNAQFSIEGRLEFIVGKGGFIVAKITTVAAEALVSTYGGQVLSFRPTSAKEDVFFVSENAHFAPGKATKGGVPICWPWFGPDPEGTGRPAHGVARNRQWEVRNTSLTPDGRVELVMGLPSNAETLAIFPYAFDLEIQITVGAELEISLTTCNRGDEDFIITQAMHSYFSVGDIDKAGVRGLGGSLYIDKMDANRVKGEHGLVRVSEETDRIYLNVGKDIEIIDDVFARSIAIKAEGCASAVVWNPWIDTAAAMADLAADDYKHMICVETGNVATDERLVPAGGETTLTTRISVAAQ